MKIATILFLSTALVVNADKITGTSTTHTSTRHLKGGECIKPNKTTGKYKLGGCFTSEIACAVMYSSTYALPTSYCDFFAPPANKFVCPCTELTVEADILRYCNDIMSQRDDANRSCELVRCPAYLQACCAPLYT